MNYLRNFTQRNVIFTLPLLLTVIFSLSCCKDKPEPPCDDNGLPCLTHEGKNTFGCRINGAVFIPKTGASIGGTPEINYSYNETTKRFILGGYRDGENDKIENVRFIVFIPEGANSYQMNVTGSTQDGYVHYGSGECTYFHNPSDPGTVNITYINEEDRIIAGTFSMVLINNDCAESTTMNITDGRFDIRF